MLVALKKGMVGTDAIDATLTAYNTSCGEMRSEAREAFSKKKKHFADQSIFLLIFNSEGYRILVGFDSIVC